jgi:hypothetical protein
MREYPPAELFGVKQEEDQQTVRKSRKRVAVATQATRLYRETFPELEIIIGNTSSSAAIIASLLRHGFDTSLVDFIGIETAAGQTGMPERLWQGGPQGAYLSRELTRRFGHDLLVTGCYEYTSHCDRHPGVQRRAEFYVRDALDGTHSWSLSPDGSLSQTTGGLPRFVPRRFSLRSVDDSERGPCRFAANRTRSGSG